MVSIESVGKNLEIAIETGLSSLGAKREDVEIRVIDAGGIFKKAKVLIILDEEIEKAKKSNKEQLDESNPKTEIKNEPKAKSNEKLESESESESDSDNEVEQKFDKIVIFDDVENEFTQAFCEFISEIMSRLGIKGSIHIKSKDDDYEMNLETDNNSMLIGSRGDTLNAWQYISNIIVGKKFRNNGRVYINVGDYKQNREQSLIKLARKMAVKVAKSKISFTFEPMNAFERRIVHTALQNDSFVETESIGNEPYRKVIIKSK